MTDQDCWSILEISPTDDRKVLKRAYAKKLKLHPPESDPEGFKRLRAAYEEAQEYSTEHGDFQFESIDFESGNSIEQKAAEQKTESDPESSDTNNENQGNSTNENPNNSTNEDFDSQELLAQTLAKKIWALVDADNIDEAILETQNILNSDQSFNIVFLDQFEHQLLGHFFDELVCENWPHSFAEKIGELFSIEERAKREDRFYQLTLLFKQQLEAIEEQRKETADINRKKHLNDIRYHVEQIYSALRDENIELASSLASKTIDEIAADERSKFMFNEHLAEHLEKYLQLKEWPAKFISIISEFCELTAEHRADSPHKKLIDYIEARTNAHEALNTLKNSSQNSDSYQVLNSLNSETFNNLSSVQKNSLKNIVNTINRDFPSLWLYELKHVADIAKSSFGQGSLSNSTLPPWFYYIGMAIVALIIMVIVNLK